VTGSVDKEIKSLTMGGGHPLQDIQMVSSARWHRPKQLNYGWGAPWGAPLGRLAGPPALIGWASERLGCPRISWKFKIAPKYRGCCGSCDCKPLWGKGGLTKGGVIISIPTLLLLQSITSRFCGHYCVCFCIVRSRGIDIRRFLRYFTRHTGL